MNVNSVTLDNHLPINDTSDEAHFAPPAPSFFGKVADFARDNGCLLVVPTATRNKRVSLTIAYAQALDRDAITALIGQLQAQRLTLVLLLEGSSLEVDVIVSPTST